MTSAVTGGERTYRSTVAAVTEWRPAPVYCGPLAGQLARHLDVALNVGIASRWDRNVVEPGYGPADCDVVVNGAIGVLLVRQLTEGGAQQFDRLVERHARRFQYVVVGLIDMPTTERTRWHYRQHKWTAERLGLLGIEYVSVWSDHAPAASAPQGPSLVPRPAVAVAAVVILALGLLLMLWTANVAVPVLATVVAAVVMGGLGYIVSESMDGRRPRLDN